MKFVTVTLSPAIVCRLGVEGTLSPGCVHRILNEGRIAGGKGINVARVLSANGHKVLAGGIMGRADAPFYNRELFSNGIQSDFLTVKDRVRENLIISTVSGLEMKFNRPGFAALEFDWPRLDHYISRLCESADCVFLCGSLPEAFPADTYAQIIGRLRAMGILTVADTHGDALRFAVEAGADVIKPNRAELSALCGFPIENGAQIVEQAKRLARGRTLVIVSDGPNGAYFVSRDRSFHASSPKVDALDSTGAGDALLGQFCAKALTDDGLVLEESRIALAVACGAACVEQHGPGGIDFLRVDALASEVLVRAV